MLKRIVAAAALGSFLLGVAACGADEGATSEQEDVNVWDSYCDDRGNLVYISYSGDVFVIEKDSTCP